MFDLKVFVVEGNVLFDFGNDPRGLFSLFVANDQEETMWEITPLTVQPVAVLEAKVVGLRVPAEVGKAILRQIVPPDDDAPHYPPVQRLIYGHVPSGYREAVKAAPLISGVKYCVQAWGEGFFDQIGAYFTAP